MIAAARVIEAGGERGGLAEVAAEADHAEMRVERLQPRQDREAVVRAAVVDDEDLVRTVPTASACRSARDAAPRATALRCESG